VALVMSGPTTDGGWNAGAYKALQAIRSQLHLSDADSPYVENAKSSGDQEKNLRAFATDGANVVFAHGNEYEAPALRMEKDFPKTMFVISSGKKVGANTMPIVYKLEDGAYLLGMLAAGMSKTGKLASVGAEQIPPVKSVFDAFAAGAKAVKPGITILNPVYTGSWDDPGKAKAATLPLIDQGADIIMQDVDAAAPGIFSAVKERTKADHPVFALGTNSDQNAMAPDVILASAPIDSVKVFVDIATQARAGTLKANDKPFGMPEGVIGFVLNPQLLSKVPADLKAKIEDTQKKITDKSFVVPVSGS
jgi:basic membrane lipoprotein Med (substrate-binding protein (PBP1-ABC) superfamily)